MPLGSVRTSLRQLLLPPVLAGLVAAPATAQWQPLGPPGAGIRSIAADPAQAARLYAGSLSNGVFVSEDGGLLWTERSQGLPKDEGTGSVQTVYGVSVDPTGTRVYAATGKGLYLSTNAGLGWGAHPLPTGLPGIVRNVLLDPADSERLILQYYRGVYCYELVGEARAWVQSTGITSLPIHEIEPAPAEPGTYFAVAAAVPKLYRSDDGATSWQVIGPIPGTALRDLEVDPASVSRLYVATDTGAYVTTNGGVDWTRMDDPADEADIHQFAHRGGALLASGRGAFFTNVADPGRLAFAGGFHFTRAAASLSAAGDRLLLATDMGLFDGTWDGSESVGAFTLRAQGMNGADVSVFRAAPGSPVLYAGTGQSFDAGLYRSDDGGLTWSHRAAGLRNPDIRSMAVFPGNPDIVYIGTTDALDDTGEDGGVWKTTDGGLTWTDVSAGIPHPGGRIIIAVVVHPTDPDIVYASVQSLFGGIYKSTDGGTTWSHVSTGLESMPETPGWEEFHNYYAMLSLAAHPLNSDVLFIGAGGCWGGTYRSNDGAASWIRRGEGYMEIDSNVLLYAVDQNVSAELWFPVHLELFDIDVAPWDPNRLFATGARGDLFLTGPQMGIVFQSRDGGETWTIVRERSRTDYFAAPTASMALHALRPGELYVGARDGIKMSLDDGATWGNLNDGLAPIHQFTRGVAFDEDDPNRLYLATAFGGVWARDLEPVAVTFSHLGAALLADGRVEVHWGVADAVDHAGFFVERETAGVRARLTGALLSGRSEYRFVDDAPVPGTENRYWVVELDRAGRTTAHGPLTVVVPASVPVTARLGLGPARPNPMRGETRMTMSGVEPGAPVAVRVLDARGRRVAELPVTGGPGAEVVWTGTDARGERVPAGVYFLEARAGARRATARVLVLP